MLQPYQNCKNREKKKGRLAGGKHIVRRRKRKEFNENIKLKKD